jgi:hypothetical protein
VKNDVKKCLSAISIIRPAFKIGDTIIKILNDKKIANKTIGKNSL